MGGPWSRIAPRDARARRTSPESGSGPSLTNSTTPLCALGGTARIASTTRPDARFTGRPRIALAGHRAGPVRRPDQPAVATLDVAPVPSSSQLPCRPPWSMDGLVMRYGATTAVDRLSLRVEPGPVTAVLGPNGAGKTTTLETCEGFRRPQAGTVRVLGLDPVADAAALLPRIGVMLQSGGAWSGVPGRRRCCGTSPGLHAHPLPGGHAGRPARAGRVRAHAVPAALRRAAAAARAGDGGGRAARSWCSSTSRPPGSTRRPAARPGTSSRELRADGVTVVLTTHYMDEAERLADEVHVDRPGPGGRVRVAGRAGPRRRRAHDPPVDEPSRLPDGRLLPPGARPERAGRAGCDDGTGDPLLATLAAWCAEHGVLPRPVVGAAPWRTSSSSSPAASTAVSGHLLPARARRRSPA